MRLYTRLPFLLLWRIMRDFMHLTVVASCNCYNFSRDAGTFSNENDVERAEKGAGGGIVILFHAIFRRGQLPRVLPQSSLFVRNPPTAPSACSWNLPPTPPRRWTWTAAPLGPLRRKRRRRPPRPDRPGSGRGILPLSDLWAERSTKNAKKTCFGAS